MPMNKAYRFFKLLLKRPFQWLYRTTVIGAGKRAGGALYRLRQPHLLRRPVLEGLALREQVSYIAKAR